MWEKSRRKIGVTEGVAWGLRTYLLLYLLLFQSQEAPGIWNMKIGILNISTLGNLVDQPPLHNCFH